MWSGLGNTWDIYQCLCGIFFNLSVFFIVVLIFFNRNRFDLRCTRDEDAFRHTRKQQTEPGYLIFFLMKLLHRGTRSLVAVGNPKWLEVIPALDLHNSDRTLSHHVITGIRPRSIDGETAASLKWYGHRAIINIRPPCHHLNDQEETSSHVSMFTAHRIHQTRHQVAIITRASLILLNDLLKGHSSQRQEKKYGRDLRMKVCVLTGM